jgi:hypothetical protein
MAKEDCARRILRITDATLGAEENSSSSHDVDLVVQHEKPKARMQHTDIGLPAAHDYLLASFSRLRCSSILHSSVRSK